MSDKKAARKKALAARDAMSVEARADASDKIENLLFGFEPFASASTIMFFVSFRSEVDTERMIRRALEAGKRVVVPITKLDTGDLIPSELRDYDADLKPGTYGVMEPSPEAVRPVEPQEIDIVIMPGAAFDRSGGRIGYGGGFYDRFLGRLRPDVATAALAFNSQIVDSAPVEPHDRRVQFIVTENEIIDCR